MKNVIYYGLSNNPFVMVNPKITWKSEDKFWVWDSCFSFDVAFYVKIKRHKWIKVKYQNEKGETKTEVFIDDFSELFQHEIDHLFGVLATDYLADPKDIMMRSEWEENVKN